MNEQEVAEMMRRIDEGIILAQKRLVQRAIKENDTLVVCIKGRIVDLPAKEIRFH